MSGSPLSSSEIRLYSGGAARRVVSALAPEFEKATGYRLSMTFEIVSRIQERLAAGDRPDLIMLPRELLAQIEKTVPFGPEGCTALPRVGIGVIVRDGVKCPDLSDEASVRDALRSAKAVALADPRTPTGRHLNGMLGRLGLLEELQDRLIHVGAIHGGAEHVASGAADLGLYLASEIQHIKGVKLTALLPAALQNYVVYGAAVPACSQESYGALSFVRFMSESANAIYWSQCGFDPFEPGSTLSEH